MVIKKKKHFKKPFKTRDKNVKMILKNLKKNTQQECFRGYKEIGTEVLISCMGEREKKYFITAANQSSVGCS